MKRYRGVFSILLFACLVTSKPAHAEDPFIVLPQDLPTNVLDLNRLLSTKDWNGLRLALKEADGDPRTRVKAMNWLRREVFGGAEYLVVLFYMRELWNVGTEAHLDGMRQTAGAMALYAYELISIDGAKCQDPTAPSSRATQLFQLDSSIFSFVKTQSPEIKEKMTALALAVEKRTSQVRHDDDLLCRGGLDEYKAALEGGTQTEVPNTTGHVGKTIRLAPPADWKPKFAPPEVYLPKQEIARKAMRDNLLQLVR